tara:strand:+ start:2105 stop:2299 length:195 start_codon:yes stop_codon:yes gene_type:complete
VLDKTTLIRYSINMMKDVEKITEVVLTVLEDFDYSQTNISSEAARLEIAKAIAAKLLNDAPVVQ